MGVHQSRMVKILMQPRARSISGARPVVHGTESCRHARLPGWIVEKAGHCPCPDDLSRDGNARHTLLVTNGVSLLQTN